MGLGIIILLTEDQVCVPQNCIFVVFVKSFVKSMVKVKCFMLIVMPMNRSTLSRGLSCFWRSPIVMYCVSYCIVMCKPTRCVTTIRVAVVCMSDRAI